MQISINKNQEPQTEEKTSKEESNKGLSLVDDGKDDEKLTDADKQKAIINFINEDIKGLLNMKLWHLNLLHQYQG
ncbi:hypothetical protein [Rossellomorea vietnamensis]|uniref:hypothetical protein n=1 Tax=Rossellomorea vietnamensis TaxID=218284 RepID=UPI003D2DB6FD